MFLTLIFSVMKLDTDFGLSGVFQNKIREFNMACVGNRLFFYFNFFQPLFTHVFVNHMLFGSKLWIGHRIIKVSNALVNEKSRYMPKSIKQEWYIIYYCKTKIKCFQPTTKEEQYENGLFKTTIFHVCCYHSACYSHICPVLL